MFWFEWFEIITVAFFTKLVNNRIKLRQFQRKKKEREKKNTLKKNGYKKWNLMELRKVKIITIWTTYDCFSPIMIRIFEQ